MKKSALPIFLAFAFYFSLNGQIKVSSTNNVGIGVESPVSKLSVGDVGNTYTKAYFYNSSTGGNQRAGQFLQASQSSLYGYGVIGSTVLSTNKCVGVYGSVYSSTTVNGPRAYGLYGLAGNGENGYNYGVFAQLLGSRNGAAIYGIVPGKTEGPVGSGFYSAYLLGKVYIEDSLRVSRSITCQILYQTSDELLKRNIKPVAAGNLDKIIKLNAVSYNMISEDNYLRSTQEVALDTATIMQEPISLEPDKQTHIGLIAQDLQKVYPELVKADENGLLSVNYSGLIPLLIEAMKEQQTEIEALKAQVVELTKKVGP
ncbi:MAG: tail fiber domain-containing protein [Bacteroidales bacterium]